MENKFTRNYATQLAKGLIPSNNKEAFVEGYMDALKHTAATELLEVLIEGFNLADKLQMPTESELNAFKTKALAAIKKAKGE